MADNQHLRYTNKLLYFKEIYGKWKRCLKTSTLHSQRTLDLEYKYGSDDSKFIFECMIKYYTYQWWAGGKSITARYTD